MSDDEKQRLSPVATKQRRQRLQSVHLGTVPDLSELDGDSARGRSPPRTEGEIRVGDQMRVTKQAPSPPGVFVSYTCQDTCIPLYTVPASAGEFRRALLCCGCCGKHANECRSKLPSNPNGSVFATRGQGTKYDNIVTVVNADWNNGMIKVEMDGVTKSYNAFNLKPVHQKKKRASPTRANRSPYRAPVTCWPRLAYFFLHRIHAHPPTHPPTPNTPTRARAYTEWLWWGWVKGGDGGGGGGGCASVV